MENYLEKEMRIYQLLDRLAQEQTLSDISFVIKAGNKDYKAKFIKEETPSKENYSLILKNNAKLFTINCENIKFSSDKKLCKTYTFKSNFAPDERKIKVYSSDNNITEALFLEKDLQTNKVVEKSYDLNTNKIKKVFVNPFTFLKSNEKIFLPLGDETYAYNTEEKDYYLIAREDISIDYLLKRLKTNKENLLTLQSRLNNLNINISNEFSNIVQKIEKKEIYLNSVKKDLKYAKDKFFKLPAKLTFISTNELKNILDELEKRFTEIITVNDKERVFAKK